MIYIRLPSTLVFNHAVGAGSSNLTRAKRNTKSYLTNRICVWAIKTYGSDTNLIWKYEISLLMQTEEMHYLNQICATRKKSEPSHFRLVIEMEPKCLVEGIYLSDMRVAKAASLALMLQDRAEPSLLFLKARIAMILHILRTWRGSEMKG